MKIAIFVSALAMTTLLITPALATSGRLNSAGCHNSKKVGYHCHRAQPATKKTSTKQSEKAKRSPTTPKEPPGG